MSGTVGEDAAVRCLLGGATDYVLKDRLAHLVPALQRALREAENWRARKRAEEAMQASEQRYRRLFEASKDGILLLDPGTGSILDANPSAVNLLGHRLSELLGKTAVELGIFEEDSGAEAAFREVAARKYAHFPDLKLATGDGLAVDVELVASAYEVNGQRVVQLNLRDITERRRLEDELRQSQKLEAVGRLAGGVAHDFNNLLAVINSYTELALDSLVPEHPLYADFEEVKKAGLRAAKLTGQLLSFSRKQILQPEICSLNTVVSELEKMLRRVIGEDVALSLRLAADLGNVRADPGQLEQVLMNLVLNSRDAMERGGTILISTANADRLPEYARNRAGAGAGPYVCCSVSDTGCGMDEATLARMFEPFFTTKSVGKGTGLGLSTVYGIVKQSGGHIDVESQVGKGTTVRVYLPRQEADVAQAPQQGQVEALPPRATETILLVEDEPSVRRLLKRILSPLGFQVLAAESGAEALLLHERHRGPIHLLLTDVVLPGMDGCEVARALTAARPEVKVLYMTGYIAEAVFRHGPMDPAVLIQKPFTVADLVRRIRGLLASSAPEAMSETAV